MTRYVTQGQDNWRARTGYQNTPRVPGPIQPMEQPSRGLRGWLRALQGERG